MGATFNKGNPCAPGYGRDWALDKEETPEVFDSQFLRSHKADSANLYPPLLSKWSQTQLCVKQRLFSWTDSFKVKTNAGKEVLDVQGAFFTMRGKATVNDPSGELIAVIIRQVLTIKRAFYIYAPIERVPDQEPSSETGPDGQPLYSWALVSMMPFECTVRPSLRMAMATGNNTFGDEIYHGRKPAMCTYKMDVTKDALGCCRIDRGSFQFECANCYSLTIAQGIDPVLMVCYTIVKDELDESGGTNRGCADGD